MTGAYALPAILILIVIGLALLGAGVSVGLPRQTVAASPAWAQRRFSFTVYALIFLAFDMEMIFMYPWAVVFAGLGVSAFIDMLVFIAILSSGIAYAWGLGGFKWE